MTDTHGQEDDVYYHCRPLKYVEYGKVLPSPDPDPDLLPAYRWLGHYCGYCPQIWLSRGDISMTGARNLIIPKKVKGYPGARRDMRANRDSVLFCFDLIRGFPVDSDVWCVIILYTVMNMPKAGLDAVNRQICINMDEWAEAVLEDDPHELEHGYCPPAAAWLKCRDISTFLKQHVFVERDQVVVPSLNLKAAKEIICRDERQKKALRRMGFIEDRITIRNIQS